MAELREVSLTDRIEASPVVATGHRWLCAQEDKPEAVESYFLMYPESRADPERASFGSVTDPVPPFSPGGGLIPVLLKMDDGRLACLTRTGAPHVGTGSEVSISFSEDRGASWSDYALVARGEPDDQLDYRDHSWARRPTARWWSCMASCSARWRHRGRTTPTRAPAARSTWRWCAPRTAAPPGRSRR